MVITAMGLCLIICVLAYRANARFRTEQRLPMQWWLTGDVTWSAPRPLALAFIPVLAIGVFGALVIVSVFLEPRAGQEGYIVPILVGLGVTFIAIQLAHFWMIANTVRRKMG